MKSNVRKTINVPKKKTSPHLHNEHQGPILGEVFYASRGK